MSQSYNLSYSVDVKASVSSIKNLANQIQSALNGLTLPKGFAQQFSSEFDKLSKNLLNYEAIAGKGLPGNKKEMSQSNNSWQQVEYSVARINSLMADLANTPGLNLVSKQSQADLDQLNKSMNEYKKSLDEVRSKEEYKGKTKKISDIEQRIQDLQKLQRLEQKNADRATVNKQVAANNLANLGFSSQDLQQYEAYIEQAKNIKTQLESAVSAKGEKQGSLLQNLGFGSPEQAKAELNNVKQILEQLENYKANLGKETGAQARHQLYGNQITEQLGQIQLLKQELQQLEQTGSKGALDQFLSKLGALTGQDLSNFTGGLGDIQRLLSNFETKSIARAGQSFDQTKQKAQELNGVLESGAKVNERYNQTFNQMMTKEQDLANFRNRFSYFFSLTGITQTVRRVFRDVTSTIKELDSVMTETAVVTDFTVSDMWDKLPEYTKKASELGTSIASLYEATTLYYQQGLGDQAAMDVGVETMKMARIANMDAADATEAMTAALRGFNMEINETSATRINDVYSELAAITAADTEQIATAMTKTASIASSANMEFETTAAFLAQIIETTQEAPETAGTAMKTIIARFTEVKELYSEGMLSGEDGEGEAIEINKIDKALQSVGISLKDFLLGKKGIDDIFLELASKWDTLDLATQRYIATTAAGSRQQSRFIAMMSDYGRTMELVNAAQNSTGASQQQFDKTLESLDSKMERLKNAWHEFVMDIVNSDLVKGGIDVLTKLLEGINKITEAFGRVGGPLAKVGLVLGGFNLGRSLFLRSATGKGGLGGLIASAMGSGKAGGKIGGAVTQTFGQSLMQNVGASISKSNWAQNYLVADSILGRAWNKIYKPVTGADAPLQNPFYGKVTNFLKKGKTSKALQGEIKLDKELLEMAKAENLTDDVAAFTGNIAKNEALVKQMKGGQTMAIAGAVAEVVGDVMEGAGATQGNEKLESWGSGLKAGGAIAATLGTVSSALAAFGMAIPGANIIIAATAALVGLYKGLEKATYLKSDEHALELAQANKKVAQETAVKEQERVKNMQSLTEGLSERYAEIDKMSRGSSEWKTAVAELNSEIASSIAEVPELSAAFKMEGGILRADINKLDEISATVEDQAQVAETNLAIASHEETIAENNLEASNLFDEMFNGKWGKKWEDDGRKRSMMDQLLRAYREGRLNDMDDVTAIVGPNVNKGYDYQDVILNINKYAANQAESAASQASLNQTMISSAQETGAITDTDAETLSGLSETFLDNMYQQSEAEAKENLEDWSRAERRDNRLEYARENNLKYQHGIGGLWSKFKDENGNVVSVTDDMIRSEEINTSKQVLFNQRAQQMSSLLTENPLLAHAMSVGGERLTSTDLDKMSSMFIESSEGERIFNAQAFAESFGQDAKGLAALAGFEGKEGEFFGQIFENFRQRLEKRIQTAADTVEMGNVLGFSQRTMDALNSEELQRQALDFYNQMQLRGLDTDAMRASMEVFGQLAEIGDQYGLEQLSNLVDKINFNNPIEAFKQLQKAADKGTYAEKQYANAVLSSGSQIISTGAQLQYFLRSEDFDTVWEELEGIVELNKTVEPDDVLNLAESYDVLNDIMDQTGIGAVGLAKAIEMVGEGLMSADSMTDAVIAALSAMDSIGEEISRGLINASKFDPGQDENQAVGFISQAYEALNANIEKGAWGNSQNVAYLDELFGDGWRRDADAETYAQNMADLTKFLGKNVENMSNAWRMAAKGETFKGGNKDVLKELGLTLDPSTGEVRMGDQVAGMSSEKIVDTLAEGFGVSKQMARLMLADFKNYSKDFDLLLGIAKNDEKEGAERFGKTADKRTEDFDIGGNKYKGTIDKAELQAAGIAAGYIDKEGKTAGEQYWEENKEEITGGENYLLTDYYYEDGSRKGGKDLARAMGAAYLGGQEIDTSKEVSIQDYAIGAAFYRQDAPQVITGTWDEYIAAGYAEGEGEGLYRQGQYAAAQQAINQATANLAGPHVYKDQENNITWQDYINTAYKRGQTADEAYAEYNNWRAEQEAIIAENSSASWTETNMPEFDYEGMTNMIESLGATSDEAAMIAQSQIDAQLEATGQQSANLKMWSDVLGKEVDIEHQKGQNIQEEFQAAEAQAKQQQQIATLREALGMGEDGVLKVAIEGITDGEATVVTFDPDTTAVQAAREEMAKPIDVQVSFSGSGSVTATGSAGGTFTVQLAAHASGIVDAPNTHDALLGEGGPELVQTKNGAWIAGLNGPEVGTIHKGDTVYTAEETKQIFNPKKNSMPRFEGGTPGPGAYSNITSGGKGRGGDDKAEVENPFDKLYNLLRKIDEELRERERIERRYEKLLEDLGVSANKIIDISREELLQLEKERKLQEKLVEGRREQIKLYQEERAELTKYANVTQNERGEDVLRIDWDLIDTVDNKEEMSDIEEYVKQLEEWFDSLAEAEDALWEIEDTIEEIKERGEDEYFDLEEAIKDALEESYQDQIDKLEDINDAINDTNAELLDGIQKSIKKIRQDRENEKTEEELSDKQRRLSYLQMDTSGSNATEILTLQKELEEGQENYTDTLIDQKISELQEQNDEAAKQREKQIDLLQAQLDHYLETGRIWNEVYQLMDDGLDKDNGLVRGSRLEEILKNEENFAGLSAIGKQEWWVDMDKKVASALAYLEVGRQIENLGVKNREIEFYTEDGKKLKGKVDDKGNVTTADGTMYNNVYQGANGLYYAGENYETPKDPEVEGIGEGISGSGSDSGSGYGGSGGDSGYFSVTAAGKTFYGKTHTEAYNAAVEYINGLKDEALADAQAEAEGGDINASNATHIKDSYDQLIKDYDNQIANLKPTWISTKQHEKETAPKKWTATYNGKTYTYTSRSEAMAAASAAKSADLANAPGAHIYFMDVTGQKVYPRKIIEARPISVTGPHYKTGGLADFTGPAWLDGTKSRPELVLNQRDTQNFIQLKDILSSLFSHDLGNSTSTENNGDITYDIDINVESIGSDYDVDKVASRVKTLITEDARYRNNNVIGLKR